MPVLPSYRNQSIDCNVSKCVNVSFKAFIKPSDAPQANQLTGFYMKATLASNGLMIGAPFSKSKVTLPTSFSVIRHL